MSKITSGTCRPQDRNARQDEPPAVDHSAALAAMVRVYAAEFSYYGISINDLEKFPEARLLAQCTWQVNGMRCDA